MQIVAESQRKKVYTNLLTHSFFSQQRDQAMNVRGQVKMPGGKQQPDVENI